MRPFKLFTATLAIASIALAGMASADGPIRRLLTGGGNNASVAGLQQVTLNFGGQNRSYLISQPPGGGAHPAVMIFHGGEGNGSETAAASNMAAWAQANGFVAIFPNSGGSQWNDGRAETANGRDDVGFARAVIGDAAARFGVDPGRVFAAGISNGGLFTQRLACEASGSFRAYAVVAATMPADLAGRCSPSRAVPIIFFNGTADRMMPWNGGQIASVRALGLGVGGRVMSHAQTLAFWTGKDGCGASSQAALPDTTNDGTTVTMQSFACSGGAQAVFYTINGGGHNWPGSGMRNRRITGVVSEDVSATETILSFFRQYGL